MTTTDPAAPAEEIDRTVTATRDRIETSWRGLQDALDGIPEERLTEPNVVGEWSIKDLLGHVAFWDEQAVLAAQRELAGEPRRELDWEAANARDAAARRDRTLAEQREALDRAHAAVLAILDDAPRLDPRSIGLCGCLKGDTYEHYDGHAADLRAWRERAGV